MKPERSLVLLKPDAIQRGHIGEIITRFEKIGLKIVGMKMVWCDEKFSKEHYCEHFEKSFYPALEKYITLGPVVAMAIEGAEAIKIIRKMTGPADSSEAAPGTIRGDFTHMAIKYADAKGTNHTNVIHASSCKEDAEREINLWFKPEEMHTYTTVHEQFVM